MKKRLITRRRRASFCVYPCLCNRRGNRTHYGIGKSFVRGGLVLVVQGICEFHLVRLSASLESFAVGSTNPPPTPIGLFEETNSRALLEAILQLQGQLSSNQLAIERNEKDAKEAAARTVEVVSNGLRENAIVFSAQQQAFSALNAWELQVMQSSNR
jgi:hypothetical protein